MPGRLGQAAEPGSGGGGGMIPTNVPSWQASPMISGQLWSSPSGAQNLQVTLGYLQAWHNLFRVEQVLCRRNSHVQIKQKQYSGSPEDKHCLGSRKLSDLPSLEAQTVAATCTPGAQKEKDNAANVALWMNSFLNHEVNQYSPVLDDARNPDLAYENFVGQPSGDSLAFWRRYRLTPGIRSPVSG